MGGKEIDQIPPASVEYIPIGAILPFNSVSDVPDEFAILDGSTIQAEDAREFVDKLFWVVTRKQRGWNDVYEKFWTKFGGFIAWDFVTLPYVPTDKVLELAFGTTNYLTEGAEPVLAIKVRRPVSSDGPSKMDSSDPNAR